MDKFTQEYNGVYIGFLFKKIHADERALLYWAYRSPEFLGWVCEEITQSKDINDETVLHAMLGIYQTQRAEHKISRSAKRAIRQIADYLGEDLPEWFTSKTSNDLPVVFPDGFSDMQDLLQTLDPLTPHSRRSICSCAEILTYLRAHGYSTLEQVYDGFREFFYPMRREDAGYYKFRTVAQDFSQVLHGDPLWWTRDYEEHKPSTTQ